MQKIVWIMLLVAGVAGCGKKDFLNAKPASDLFIPTTLEDFQSILDRDAINETPNLGELSSDSYYLFTYTFWQGITPKERNAYIWAADTYQGTGNIGDWNVPYQQVFAANVVLDGIDKVPVTSTNQQQWSAVKGAAYFVRAYAFYNLAQIFAPVYDSATAAADLGIPLRLTPNAEEPSIRASVKATYDQILSDLANAYPLLPADIPLNNRNRPSQPAVMAMLARVYLGMRVYDKAGTSADNCLKLYNTLIDYNTVLSITPPFPRPNMEVLYQSRMLSSSNNVLKSTASNCVIDSGLYGSFDNNDLRRQLFFNINGAGLPNVKNTYTGSFLCFSGLATDEMYLTRAECYARAGNTQAAMSDLNTLLQNRWKTGSFTNLTATGPAQALALVLGERKKELFFRGLRWTDLRRLNKDGYNIVLTRVLNGQIYQLLPGDLRYVFPIPPDVITLSGIAQNPR